MTQIKKLREYAVRADEWLKVTQFNGYEVMVFCLLALFIKWVL